MAKNYILEPTEAEFTASQDMFRANVNFDWTTLDGYPGDEAEDEEIDTFLANTFSGSKFKMMYGEEPISLFYTNVDGSVRFTVSGEDVEDSYPCAWVNFADLDLMSINVTLAEGASVVPVDGTYTVSIYTGEDDPDPEPSDDLTPVTREEHYLSAIAGLSELPEGMVPVTREEIFLQEILDKVGK